MAAHPPRRSVPRVSPSRTTRPPALRYRPARRTDVANLAELGMPAFRVARLGQLVVLPLSGRSLGRNLGPELSRLARDGDLEERIAAKLGNSTRDPHGDPLPSREGLVEGVDGVLLSSLPPGTGGTVVRVPDGDPVLLQYLESLGVVPGAVVTVEAVAPYGDVLTLRVEDAVQVVGEIVNPSWLTMDRQQRFLYAAHGDGSDATAFAIDRDSGRLSLLNRQPTNGRNGVRLARSVPRRNYRLTEAARSCVFPWALQES